MNNNIEQVQHEQKTIDAFLENVRVSASRRINQEVKQRKNGFIREVLAWGTAICAIGSLYFILPLKQTQPVLAIVDGQNGIVKEVQYLEPGSKITNNEALIKSFAFAYVTERYGYYYVATTDTLKKRYTKVFAFTGDNLLEGVKNEIASNNPTSPYSLYGQTGTVEIDNITVNLFSGDASNRVQINFRKTVRESEKANPKVYSYTALGRYEFGRFENLSVDDRHLNPFGFKFVEWSISQNASNDAMGGVTSTQPTQEVAPLPDTTPASVPAMPNTTVTPPMMDNGATQQPSSAVQPKTQKR